MTPDCVHKLFAETIRIYIRFACEVLLGPNDPRNPYRR